MTLPDKFSDRLDRLEILITPLGCDHCRPWHGNVLAYVDIDTDEVTLDRPERCPSCHRDVPILREVRLVGVGPNDI